MGLIENKKMTEERVSELENRAKELFDLESKKI